MKEQAARGGPFPGSSSTTSSGGGGSARPPRPGTPEARLVEWYRVLDLSAGADLAQIKSSYRQLMRKYHPDMHAGNPQKQKAATELSMRVTTAYNGLVAYLEKK
jgi:DnaJ-domain-containing protein 1